MHGLRGYVDALSSREKQEINIASQAVYDCRNTITFPILPTHKQKCYLPFDATIVFSSLTGETDTAEISQCRKNI